MKTLIYKRANIDYIKTKDKMNFHKIQKIFMIKGLNIETKNIKDKENSTDYKIHSKEFYKGLKHSVLYTNLTSKNQPVLLDYLYKQVNIDEEIKIQ